jgi:hypothetical protein
MANWRRTSPKGKANATTDRKEERRMKQQPERRPTQKKEETGKSKRGSQPEDPGRATG